MAINYNDQRFQDVTNQKNAAMNETNNMYNNMISNSDKFYQAQIDAAKEYGEKQSEIQQANTDFAIDKVNQQKEWATKDYEKEQRAAYTDYQKQSNSYGVNSESMAASGLQTSGYAESSQVSMYNEYQNRYATARESFTRAITEYDNAIKDAQLQNNSALAEIAYNTLQKQLELSLSGFQYKNTLLQSQLSAKNDVEDRYYKRWQDVVSQINTENALAEQQRQFNEQMALQREQLNWQKQQAAAQSSSIRRSSSGGGSGSGSIDKGNIITTAYYQGELNPDAKNGTFSNGYQPNNVGGKKLTATKDKVKVKATTLQGTKTTVTQNVWKTDDGKKYIWDGSKNQYIPYK